MKLRKALTKAYESRQEPSIPCHIPPPGLVRVEEKDWRSPVYSHSRHLPIDPVIAEENRCICFEKDGGKGFFPGPPLPDFYKVLRTQILQRTQEQGWKTMMVTSAAAGEGKTLTAINLALTMARQFHQTVLLADGDLRKQDIHRYLGIASESGLGDYLLDEKSLQDLIIWPGIEKMTILSGGTTIPNSTELLDSPKMKDLVSQMKKRYKDRYVIFDVPPLLDGADAMAFAPAVDAILMVVEEGRTPLSDVKRALDLLPREKILGFILNRSNAWTQC